MINRFAIIFIMFSLVSYAQEKSFFTAFWNVENLFDTIDQPDVDDSEFLPGSEKNWDNQKFHKKLVNLSSVIMSMNNGKGPDIIGLCEVENEAVIESLLVYLSPGYVIVHRESPDGRGIDNSLLFRESLFKLLSVHSDSIELTDGEKTRSILWTRLLLNKNDTISVLVNHWPSRRGGVDSEKKRIEAASTLKNRMDAIKNDFLIAIGDFNDEPENLSIDSVLSAGPSGKGNDYINLAYNLSIMNLGSYKYRDTWNMLDQIIISKEHPSIKYLENSFDVYKPYFIIQESGNYAGTPLPTFGGKRYLGGYSDHFPVTAKFIIK